MLRYSGLSIYKILTSIGGFRFKMSIFFFYHDKIHFWESNQPFFVKKEKEKMNTG